LAGFSKKDGDFGVPVRNPGESHPTIGETASFLDRLRDTGGFNNPMFRSRRRSSWPPFRYCNSKNSRAG